MYFRGKYQKKSINDRGLLSYEAQAGALRRDRMSRSIKKIDIPGPHKTIQERTPENLEYYYSLIAASQQKRMTIFKKYDDQRKASSAPSAPRLEINTEYIEEHPEATRHDVNASVPREITVCTIKQTKSELQNDGVENEPQSHRVKKKEKAGGNSGTASGRSRSLTWTRKKTSQRNTCCMSVSTLSVSTHETSESTIVNITERSEDDDDVIIGSKSSIAPGNKGTIELLCKAISLNDRIRMLKRNQAFWNNHPARFGLAQPGRQDSAQNLSGV
jgi:hypothetical protein